MVKALARGSAGIVGWLFVATAAAAPTAGEEKAAAQFFLEGRAAMEKGDYATACPKFEESLKLVKRSGTLFALSKCAEKDLHLVRAADLMREGIVMLPVGDDRLAESKALLDKLDKRVPHVTLALAKDSPADAQVKLDGRVASLGESMAVDPGNHTWTVTAGGRVPQRGTFAVGEGEQKGVTIEVGGPLPEVASGAGGPAEAPRAEPRDGPPSKASPLRTVGFVLGGVGVASLVAGGVTGALTLAKKSDADKNCNEKTCNAAGVTAESDGKTFSTVSTITFIGGAALAGAGVVLLVTSKRTQKADATGLLVSPTRGGASLAMRGSF
jgi:hypothetical protein